MSDSPETDAKLAEGGAAHLAVVPAKFARSLERRLQEALDMCDRYAEQLQEAQREHGETLVEYELEMSRIRVERDAALREVEELKRLLRAAQGAVRVERESRIATGQHTDFHDGFLARIDAALAEKGR